MRQSEAERILRNLMFIAQKFRSNSFETFVNIGWASDAVGKKAFEDLFPWLSGDKNIVLALSRILDNFERTNYIAPLDFYNQMFVVEKWLPQLNVVSLFFQETEFPEPKTDWLRGWESEKK